jgi:pyrroline-5-carboxylate reductase
MIGQSIGFIGGGRVTRIILGGWDKAGRMPPKVVVSDVSLEVLTRLREKFPGVEIAHNDNCRPAGQGLVFLGLHPPAIPGCLGEIRSSLKPGAILVSLAPKLNLAKLSTLLGGFDRIARVIPNAPSVIGEGFNPMCFAPTLSTEDRGEISVLLAGLGKCPEVDESKLEAYAILTAMGPTYLWFQLHELQKIAESFGLSRHEVETGLSEMIAGTAKTLLGSGLATEEVMDLIPVKPLGEDEATIKAAYHARLESLYAKLRG